MSKNREPIPQEAQDQMALIGAAIWFQQETGTSDVRTAIETGVHPTDGRCILARYAAMYGTATVEKYARVRL